MRQAGGPVTERDDDRRLGRLDLVLVLAWGPLLAALQMFALLLVVGGRDLVELARRSSPVASDDDALALSTVAGAVLLSNVIAAGAWRAFRGPVRALSTRRAVVITVAALFATWFWVVMLGAIFQ